MSCLPNKRQKDNIGSPKRELNRTDSKTEGNKDPISQNDRGLSTNSHLKVSNIQQMLWIASLEQQHVVHELSIKGCSVAQIQSVLLEKKIAPVQLKTMLESEGCSTANSIALVKLFAQRAHETTKSRLPANEKTNITENSITDSQQINKELEDRSNQSLNTTRENNSSYNEIKDLDISTEKQINNSDKSSSYNEIKDLDISTEKQINNSDKSSSYNEIKDLDISTEKQSNNSGILKNICQNTIPIEQNMNTERVSFTMNNSSTVETKVNIFQDTLNKNTDNIYTTDFNSIKLENNNELSNSSMGLVNPGDILQPRKNSLLDLLGIKSKKNESSNIYSNLNSEQNNFYQTAERIKSEFEVTNNYTSDITNTNTTGNERSTIEIDNKLNLEIKKEAELDKLQYREQKKKCMDYLAKRNVTLLKDMPRRNAAAIVELRMSDHMHYCDRNRNKPWSILGMDAMGDVVRIQISDAAKRVLGCSAVYQFFNVWRQPRSTYSLLKTRLDFDLSVSDPSTIYQVEDESHIIGTFESESIFFEKLPMYNNEALSLSYCFGIINKSKLDKDEPQESLNVICSVLKIIGTQFHSMYYTGDNKAEYKYWVHCIDLDQRRRCVAVCGPNPVLQGELIILYRAAWAPNSKEYCCSAGSWRILSKLELSNLIQTNYGYRRKNLRLMNMLPETVTDITQQFESDVCGPLESIYSFISRPKDESLCTEGCVLAYFIRIGDNANASCFTLECSNFVNGSACFNPVESTAVTKCSRCGLTPRLRACWRLEATISDHTSTMEIMLASYLARFTGIGITQNCKPDSILQNQILEELQRHLYCPVVLNITTVTRNSQLQYWARAWQFLNGSKGYELIEPHLHKISWSA